jgi:phage/plasmid-like protein (TIGR03299 family)
VVRTDVPRGDHRRVLGVVHPDFRPLQNREGAEMFHRLLDVGERRYHTGGYLRSGEVVWLLARLPHWIAVDKNDAVETYLLYSNSHDGSQAIEIRLTTVRVVCRNTLSQALHTGGAQAFRRAHRPSSDAIEKEAKTFFEATRKSIEETQALFRRLASRRCDDGSRPIRSRPQACGPVVRKRRRMQRASRHWRRTASRCATFANRDW